MRCPRRNPIRALGYYPNMDVHLGANSYVSRSVDLGLRYGL
jgi:hypothetical protein